MVKEIGGGQLVNSSNNMGYLNSVLSSSSQVHAEDEPVSGGGLRFFFLVWIMVFCWICCFVIDLYLYLMGLLYLFNFYFVLFVVNYESLVHVLCCCYGKLWCIYCCGLMFLILQYQGLIVNIGNLMCLIPKCEALLMWVFVYKFITHWG